MRSKTARPIVLVLSCSGGAGHVRAGQALKQWADDQFPDLVVEHQDILEYTSPHFKRLYARGYFHVVQRARHLWGALYERTASTSRQKSPFIRIFDHFNYRKYVRSIRSLQPDAIVCTHFLPFLAVDSKIADLRIPSPFYAVGTDFNLHALWASQVVRTYYVFSEETAALLSAKGIPPDRIHATGIPIMKEFSARTGKMSARSFLNLPERGRTILILTGGEGMGNVTPVVAAVLASVAQIPGRSTVIVIAGRNHKLASELRTVTPPQGVTLRIEGFVTNMHDFMHASDIVITKSGGLTSSEALACGLPMIIVDPIPGQERLNADILLEKGIARLATDPDHVGYKVRQALEDPGWLKSASGSARVLARPASAGTILRHLIQHIDGTGRVDA